MHMRIRDISAGYLGNLGLKQEHDELHRLDRWLRKDDEAGTHDPELLRWATHGPALVLRHQLVVAEMTLRGMPHGSPLRANDEDSVWPIQYVFTPGRQFVLLAEEQELEGIRIPVPANSQQLWAQHKYSVMARDPQLYRTLGPGVAHGQWRDDFSGLAELLVDALRRPPEPGRMRNALQHMWGHLHAGGEAVPAENGLLLQRIQQLASMQQERYLLHSTALSELAVWSSGNRG